MIIESKVRLFRLKRKDVPMFTIEDADGNAGTVYLDGHCDGALEGLKITNYAGKFVDRLERALCQKSIEVNRLRGTNREFIPKRTLDLLMNNRDRKNRGYCD